jgi:hypothetical protein
VESLRGGSGQGGSGGGSPGWRCGGEASEQLGVAASSRRRGVERRPARACGGQGEGIGQHDRAAGLTERRRGVQAEEAVGAKAPQGGGGTPVVARCSGKVLQHRRWNSTVKATPF